METEHITDLLSKATMGALFLGAIYHSSLFGLGHKSIKERVHELKGSVVIQGNKQGTHIHLSIPAAKTK